MKKMIVITGAFIISYAGLAIGYQMESISIQMPNIKSFYEMPTVPIIITNIFMQEGTNTIPVKANKSTIRLLKKGDFFFANKSTIRLLKKGDFFFNVIFTDYAGNTFRLMPKHCGNSICTIPLSAACFGNHQTTVINICRQPNEAGKPDALTITILQAGKKANTR